MAAFITTLERDEVSACYVPAALPPIKNPGTL
jgi:hypothetical protein